MTTYREAITAFKVGDRVSLTLDHGEYPLTGAKAGETGTVVENALSDPVDLTLYVKLDEHHADLDEWDNVLHYYAPEKYGNSVDEWDTPIHLEKID